MEMKYWHERNKGLLKGAQRLSGLILKDQYRRRKIVQEKGVWAFIMASR